MSSKYLSFVIATTSFLSSSIVSSHVPAGAHSLDICVEIQQEIAAETAFGKSNRQLRQKFPEEFEEYEQSCESDLKASGLISLEQIKANKTTANLILNGQNALLDLDPVKKQQDKTKVNELSTRAVRLRQQICAQVEPEEAFACDPSSVDELP